jgi:acetylornithine deacetylase/succinyl-diaminopimelate desuccinylase-like protein
MNEIFKHIDDNLPARLQQLFEWLRIPSVSADPAFAGDCRKAADWLKERLLAAGMEQAEVVETGGHPAIYAQWMGAGEGKPTVLFYGHYDVQPAVKEDGWTTTEPFEPIEREGRLYGRGTADDKGQVHVHLAAVESLMQVTGSLPCNIKFIVEGEEEAGSEHTEALIRDNARKLACDVVVVSDSPMFAEGYPSICLGLRGLAYGEVIVDGPAGDLHSGSFGGGVANPANVLARMLAGLHDDQGRVAVQGFYDDVVPLSDEQRAAIAGLPFDEQEWLSATGSPRPAGEAGFSTLERIWARPTIDINGMDSGYTGEGAKTIVPRRASSKLSARLVANQDPDRVLDQLEAYFKQAAPDTVKVSFVRHHTGRAYLGASSAAPFVAARKALREAFDADPVEIREGGSIPIVATFEEALQAPCVLMGFGLPDQNIHGPDENLRVVNYHKGTRAIAAFLVDYAG